MKKAHTGILKGALITSVITVLAATTGKLSALPSPTAGSREENKTKADSITLEFPQDRSLGKLYKVIVTNNPSVAVQNVLCQARGLVRVPRETRLRLEPSYYGARDVSLLLKLPGKMIVSIDCRHLDNLTDEAVAQMAKLPGLLQLFVDDTDITDKSLASIGQMKELTDLEISETSITSNGLAKLSGLTSLKRLCLAACKVGDSALPSLVTLKDLNILQMTRTGISDTGLRSIARLTKLQGLDVSQNHDVTDAGIAQLVTLQNVIRLEASDTRITIGCLPSLKKMKSLRFLAVSNCKITNDDLPKIKHALPFCEIGISNKPRIDPSVFSPLH